MTIPDGVSSYAGRLETFQTSHHPAKRRASSSKKRGQAQSSISWPSTAPPAEEMARAGFFFKPTATNPDNTVCFVCQRQLDGWEQDDNPALEHLTHSADCGWAINVCIALRQDNPDRIDEDPMDPRLLEARQSTFLGKWPHEHKKGWKCKVTKMIEAGWCYDPSPESDDGATCFYCNLSLDGWEPKDIPLVEHQKRSPECMFFELLEKYAATQQPKKARKGRTSTASKASRLSTQSNLTAVSEAPSVIGDAPAAEDDSVLTTATTATKAGKGGRKGASKARVGAKGKGSTARGKNVSTFEESEIVSRYQSQLDAMDLELEAPDAEATPEPPKKRTTRRGTKQEKSMLDSSILDVAPAQPKRATRTRANSRLKAPERLSEDQFQLQSEIEYAIEASMHSEGRSTPNLMRGTKRTSDGLPKLASPVIVAEPETQCSEPPVEKPKRVRKPKVSKNAFTQSYLEPRSSELEAELQEMAHEEEAKKPSRMTAKSKRGKTTQPEAGKGTQEQPLMKEHALQCPTSDAKTSTPNPTFEPAETPLATKYLQESSASPAPPTPTPAKIAPPSTRRPSPVRPSLPDRLSPRHGRTPSAASNASDEENMPPSARPTTSARRPLSTMSPNKQTVKVPLAASTPTASPSKRSNMINGLSSAFAWTATDLEAVFLPSPASNKLSRSSGFGFGSFTSLTQTEKENLAELDRLDDRADVTEVIKRVRAALTSPEKKMSVQEWIDFNAQRGEERLRGECERMVGVFEKEGGRALSSLEGIVCRG